MSTYGSPQRGRNGFRSSHQFLRAEQGPRLLPEDLAGEEVVGLDEPVVDDDLELGLAATGAIVPQARSSGE